MKRSLSARAGPWLIGAMVTTEVVLVWSGLLRPGVAVATGLVIEVILAATVVWRVATAARRYAAVRAGEADRWLGAEEALAQIVPRPLARFIVLEPRLWVSLVQQVRPHRRSDADHGYHRALRPLLWTVIALVVVEGVIVEWVAVVLGADHVWVAMAAGVHAYAVLALLGLSASFATRPHRIESDRLRLRDGVFDEIVIVRSAISGARLVRGDGTVGRSGLQIQPETGQALLAHGPANVEVSIAAHAGSLSSQRGVPLTGIHTIALTADDPRGFVRRLTAPEAMRDDPADG